MDAHTTPLHLDLKKDKHLAIDGEELCDYFVEEAVVQVVGGGVGVETPPPPSLI